MKKLTKKEKTTLIEELINRSNISDLINVVYINSPTIEYVSGVVDSDNEKNVNTRRISMQTYKVNTKYNKNSDAIKFIKENTNVDIDLEVIHTLIDEAILNLSKDVLSHIEKIANIADKEDYNLLDKFRSFLIEKVFKKSYTKTLRIKTYEDLSYNIIKYLLKIVKKQTSNHINIYDEMFVISNELTATNLQNYSPGMMMSTLKEKMYFQPITKKGTIDGNKNVYVNAYASDTAKISEVFVGYKKNSINAAGLTLFIYTNGTDITKTEKEDEINMTLTIRCAIADIDNISSKLYHKFAYKTKSFKSLYKPLL